MAHDAQAAEMGEDSTPIDLGSDQYLMWLTFKERGTDAPRGRHLQAPHTLEALLPADGSASSQ